MATDDLLYIERTLGRKCIWSNVSEISNINFSNTII